MIEVRGVSGEVRKGYRTVARLGSWALKEDGFTATSSHVDQFLVDDGGPYAVVVQVGKKQWVWPAVEVRQFAPSLVASVSGPPQVRE